MIFYCTLIYRLQIAEAYKQIKKNLEKTGQIAVYLFGSFVSLKIGIRYWLFLLDWRIEILQGWCRWLVLTGRIFWCLDQFLPWWLLAKADTGRVWWCFPWSVNPWNSMRLRRPWWAIFLQDLHLRDFDGGSLRNCYFFCSQEAQPTQRFRSGKY